ncbi:DNA polymerase phi-like protein [Flavobacterium phage vB_FspM_immuto_3-5A]|uniref:DNA polymerase phi-like protein n=1 Tax=Flavobacterium phage vB_FspM_immuto_2-6A TaxID=2801477 RepID=A0A7T8ERQ9_9CAUD|nr:DNA polymerase phi-like protein [Flavobacterium phage vB_FspM_immuto_2-6A]QQO91883.1 DNA polymerase phi-like protein [Flavobacterium phage vB_FspM_immuto_2-6A]QQO92121.1 DNA polymerase phi-like protein [Flavobacterium phage vB_FspM_immuto_3-5A]QQO92359.1 DNA polymerase phi-like protein [Flavobacterium phage vB_FspM_immuto_13-6C]
MSNKDLLKQAIAEAKTIREAAIANAKEALEESLTPHLKEMLAQKLQEMEDVEDMEEIVNEEDMINNPEGETAHGNVAEAEEEEEAEEEAPEGEEEAGEEEEEVEIEDMSIDDLKDLIRDIVSQEVGQEESEEEMPGEEAPEGEEDMVSMDGDSEEIDINELLAELEGMDNNGVNEGFEQWLDSVSAQMDKFGKNNPTIQAIEKAVSAAQDKAKKAGITGHGMTKGHKVFEESENLEEGFEQWLDSVSAQMDKFGKNNPTIQAIEKAVQAAQEKAKKAGITGHGMTKGHKISEESEELAEALATVKALKGQLQEVNLLNAKLLYVNKVFKSNNLTEGQKVNVIAAFDKAETVKEVKLVFETVSKNVVAKPATIKEHRSFASKATGNAQTTAPKEIISEVSEQVSRWQKLAGIIK